MTLRLTTAAVSSVFICTVLASVGKDGKFDELKLETEFKETSFPLNERLSFISNSLVRKW